MKTKTEKILLFLHIIAWIAFIGYCIECGSQLVTYLISLKNPSAANGIPGMSVDLFSLRNYNQWYYTCFVSFIVALSAMKAYIFYMVIGLLSGLNLQQPFTLEVANKQEQIAYQLLGIWVVSVLAREYGHWLEKTTGENLPGIDVGNEFLFVAGIVYIISQVFKRGIEIQEENQLTV